MASQENTKRAHCGHTDPCASETCWHPSIKQAMESAGVAKGTTRAEILDEAKHAVTVDRAATHGNAEDGFGLIATYWSAHLDADVSATDVAVMMGLLKIARIKANPKHLDSWTDVCGYAACGGEIANKGCDNA